MLLQTPAQESSRPPSILLQHPRLASYFDTIDHYEAAKLTYPKISTSKLQQYELPVYREHDAHDPYPRISTHGPKSQQFRHHAVKLHNWVSSPRFFEGLRHELPLPV